MTNDDRSQEQKHDRDQVCYATVRLPLLLSLATFIGTGVLATLGYLLLR
jgi:hypothetical protein